MIEIYGYEKNSLSFSGNTYVHHACGLRQQRKSRDHKHAGCDSCRRTGGECVHGILSGVRLLNGTPHSERQAAFERGAAF